MARRDFRQFGLADSIVRRRGKRSEWLDRLDAALDWPALETIVAGVHASREGGLAYPLLTYVKLPLLQRHRQVGAGEDRKAASLIGAMALCGSLGTGDLGPDREGLRPDGSVLAGGEVIAVEMEEVLIWS